jgi:hypothetical protein
MSRRVAEYSVKHPLSGARRVRPLMLTVLRFGAGARPVAVKVAALRAPEVGGLFCLHGVLPSHPLTVSHSI